LCLCNSHENGIENGWIISLHRLESWTILSQLFALLIATASLPEITKVAQKMREAGKKRKLAAQTWGHLLPDEEESALRLSKFRKLQRKTDEDYERRAAKIATLNKRGART
jgi:type II secretory pathway component PulL